MKSTKIGLTLWPAGKLCPSPWLLDLYPNFSLTVSERGWHRLGLRCARSWGQQRTDTEMVITISSLTQQQERIVFLSSSVVFTSFGLISQNSWYLIVWGFEFSLIINFTEVLVFRGCDCIFLVALSEANIQMGLLTFIAAPIFFKTQSNPMSIEHWTWRRTT